jgi:hypothetical protein
MVATKEEWLEALRGSQEDKQEALDERFLDLYRVNTVEAHMNPRGWIVEPLTTSRADALNYSFRWQNSARGFDYWYNIHNNNE